MTLPTTLGQHFAIKDLQNDVEWLKIRTRQRLGNKANRSQVEEMQSEIDELRLYIATLFRILIVKKIMPLEDLKALLVGMDAEDGEVDGAYRGRDAVTGAELPPEISPFAGLDS